MRLQSYEEYQHALRFFDFIHQRNGRVSLKSIEQPNAEFDTPLSVFEQALAHERSVTERINGLVELAQVQRDFSTHSFLEWFVDEQVEEESTAQEIVDQLRLAGGNSTALLFLDRQMAARQPEPAASQ
jgi:ferritin